MWLYRKCSTASKIASKSAPLARGALLLAGCCEALKRGLNTSHFEVTQALTFVACYGILISVPIQKEQSREAKKPWHRAKALHW